MDFPAPAPKYLGPPNKHSGRGNKPITRIVLHSTVSPCVRGQARKTAEYFRSSKARGSAHYAVDPGEVIQCAFDSIVAWHAPPNRGSLGVEMCEFPTTDVRRWGDAPHRAMMLRAARLVAELCLAYEIPPWYIGRVRVRLGRRGVTTHAQVSQAFGQSSHWDPGAWPRRRFMLQVRREVRSIKKEAKR